MCIAHVRFTLPIIYLLYTVSIYTYIYYLLYAMYTQTEQQEEETRRTCTIRFERDSRSTRLSRLFDNISRLDDVSPCSDEFAACSRSLPEISILPGAYFREGEREILRRDVLSSAFFIRRSSPHLCCVWLRSCWNSVFVTCTWYLI